MYASLSMLSTNEKLYISHSSDGEVQIHVGDAYLSLSLALAESLAFQLSTHMQEMITTACICIDCEELVYEYPPENAHTLKGRPTTICTRCSRES